ncbi:Arabinofuranosyltransferase AftA [Corynebacterium deserti GIMN1.010]|uniref:Galactan 5-O-arabinofuranosyltransferase n=1 Tax=Corynebacterium deserti GIMN1.010 TaxID=931089 RepID=A0A0M4CJT2_9CORY|nr:galactan 5-O-arabinofuranosyltransferase [Corynebacterium deserti]ALC04697.1 Arabinofuranosyltransferase AftA [Corynebacterium deserti GIMN1.010]
MINTSETEGTVPVEKDLNPFGPARAPEGDVYRPDRLDKKSTVFSIVGAAVLAFIFALVLWLALKQTNLPAFGASNVTRALSSATIAAVLVVTGLLTWAWLRDEHRFNPRWELDKEPGAVKPRPKWRVALTYLASYLSPAALVIAVLAVPLSATRLYLDGISVDQGFRTQFLTRMADEISLSDMNYIDMPTYYPAGWFWAGGRFANMLGIPGWEAFQPWAIVSMAVAASVLVPVWQRITGSLPVATGIALVTTCVILAMNAEEPYAAIVAMGIPAMIVLTARIARGDIFALCGGIIYLGVSATFYTLFTGAVALSVVAVCIVMAALLQKSIKPLIWLAILGVSSICIALTTWGPFLLASLDGAEQSGDTATHYLPVEGTQFPVPFLAPSVLGLLCLGGLVYLVVRFHGAEVRALWVAIIVFYGWMALSMAITLIGNTLLGFRLDTVLVLLFATAGVLGIADFRLASIYKMFPTQISERTATFLTNIVVIVVLLGGLSYAQDLPQKNAHAIDLAYTDTDGYGERADLYPAGSARYYNQINTYLLDQGFEPSETVVLTDELDFMSYYPYRGFQAFTSHYANPLGEFGHRNKVIEDWAIQSWDGLSDPQDFSAALEEAPWVAPEVFIFRGSVDDPDTGWKYDVAEDLYPNNPNVRFRGVFFNPESFGELWQTEQIGPFVVVTRNE